MKVTPTALRALHLVAAAACAALALTVFKDATGTRDDLIKAAIGLGGIGGVTIHDRGHLSVFGIPIPIGLHVPEVADDEATDGEQ